MLSGTLVGRSAQAPAPLRCEALLRLPPQSVRLRAVPPLPLSVPAPHSLFPVWLARCAFQSGSGLPQPGGALRHRATPAGELRCARGVAYAFLAAAPPPPAHAAAVFRWFARVRPGSFFRPQFASAPGARQPCCLLPDAWLRASSPPSQPRCRSCGVGDSRCWVPSTPKMLLVSRWRESALAPATHAAAALGLP